MSNLMDVALEAGNLHYNKQYDSAIKLLDRYFKLVIDREELAQFHIEYAICYEKLKDIKKCNYHCEEAIKLNHIGTYAYQRLIINYVKDKDWVNALRVCDITLKREKVFNKQTWESISSYAIKRKEFILKKMKENQKEG
jgi:tetratricopeptide (TPR) repeat protein